MYLQENDEKVKIKNIAEFYNISKNHLSVAVNKLSELGYVKSTPGPKGGIEFNKAFKNKTLKDLIEQTEEFIVVECFDAKKNKCILSPSCKLKEALSKGTKAFLGELNKVQIKDLV
jgi:Rrf2 family nitric oxide-sensitive transcriptional repressor